MPRPTSPGRRAEHAAGSDRPGTADSVVNLGARLREVRLESGLSLREVARKLGVSASLVSQLETGKSQPSVVTLYSLTQLLGVSIDQLFADAVTSFGENRPESDPDTASGAEALPAAPAAAAPVSRSELGSPADAWPQAAAAPRLSVTRPGDRSRLVMDSGVIWEQLAANTGPNLDFIEVIYPPFSSSTNDGRMLRHSGFEYGYLMEGELEVTVGFEVFKLCAGESLGFDSSVPHLFRNQGSVAARGIWCVRHAHP